MDKNQATNQQTIKGRGLAHVGSLRVEKIGRFWAIREQGLRYPPWIGAAAKGKFLQTGMIRLRHLPTSRNHDGKMTNFEMGAYRHGESPCHFLPFSWNCYHGDIAIPIILKNKNRPATLLLNGT